MEERCNMKKRYYLNYLGMFGTKVFAFYGDLGESRNCIWQFECLPNGHSGNVPINRSISQSQDFQKTIDKSKLKLSFGAA